MPISQIDPPKILKVITQIVIKTAIVEGYEQPVLLVDNREGLPTPEVIEQLLTAARLLQQFPEING